MSSASQAQEETYNNAVQALFSPLHQATTPDALREAAARRTNTLQDMNTYLQRIGLDINNSECVPKLIVHLTGTKGKGSTLAFCESILRNGYGLTTGMFTSPHLVCIRERIRVNGMPVSEEVFAKVYWNVRRSLESFDGSLDGSDCNGLPPLPKLPGYFRMLSLMAIYTFCHCSSPKIDAMLLEVGMGGRYDCTNVFEPTKHNIVRGVTLIDYDHMRVLGSTLEQIAWEKGGIFCSDKESNIGMNDGGYDEFVREYKQSDAGNSQQNGTGNQTKVFASNHNTDQVLEILRYIISNDAQKGHLQTVSHTCLDSHVNLGLEGQHQRSNAALALAISQYAMDESLNSEKLQHALTKTYWPGRCQSVKLSSITNKLPGIEVSINLRCDGAHTPISINACIDWFRSVASDKESIHRVLVFNCSHERNPLPLLYSLHRAKLFNSIYFCRANFERPSMLKKKLEEQWYSQPIDKVTLKDMCASLGTANCDAPTWQETLANVWKLYNLHDAHFFNASCNLDQTITFGLDVESALQEIRYDSASMQLCKKTSNARVEICVTGSLYIVGSALEAAGWNESSIDCKLY